MKNMLFLTVLILLPSCYFIQEPVIPIVYYDYSSPNTMHNQEEAVIFFPGIGDGPEVFKDHGFAELLSSCNQNLRILAVNAHISYIKQRTLMNRIQEDIIKPAQDSGITRFWLVGISLGGLSSLLYYRHDPDSIKGIILLSPFLGNIENFDDSLNAPNVSDGDKLDRNNDLQQLWRDLIDLFNTRGQPNIYMGYGDSDGFAPLLEKFSQLIPRDHTIVIPGSHSWITWSSLWGDLLKKSELCIQ